MRYELTDYEWAAIKPFLPNRPRGCRAARVLRSGAPGRDLPDAQLRICGGARKART